MRLTIESLGKDYGAFAALHNIDLTVESGELVALLGPSGSGKTTLLRAIAGLLPVDRGRILFGDDDATALSLRERRVGFVFQHYALFDHMTVAQNVAFGLRVRPWRARPDRAAIAARVDALLGRVQLSGLSGRYPSQLSGGQRQRVALARAMAIDPTVLLLDEPFGALDAKVRVELRRWLRQIHDETGHTTLFVTHDQDEAMELADRVVVLNNGRIEQIGTPDEVYRQPATPFVFDFIGRGGGIGGWCDDGHFVVSPDTAPLPLPPSQRHLSGPARLLVRPHDLCAVDAGQGIRVRVASVRQLAGRATLDLELAAQPLRLEMDIDAGTALPSRGTLLDVRPRHYVVFGEPG